MGIGQMLGEVMGEVSKELRRQWNEIFTIRDPAALMDEALKLMYGSGEVSREQYFQYQEKLRKGQIGQGDLAILRRAAAGKPDASGWKAQDPAIRSALRLLYLDLATLEDVQAEVEGTLAGLEADAGQVSEQASQAAELAQSALPDEREARAYLELKEKLGERSEILAERVQSLRASLRRVEALRSELKTYETELKLLAAEERLAGLEANVREGLAYQTYGGRS